MMWWGGHTWEKGIATAFGRRTGSFRASEPHPTEPTPTSFPLELDPSSAAIVSSVPLRQGPPATA